MDTEKAVRLAKCAAIVMVSWLIHSVTAAGKGNFYEEASDEGVLNLRCNGDCSSGISLAAIVIYNATSQAQLVVWKSDKYPVAFREPSSDMSVYAELGFHGEDVQCHLKLLISGVKAFTRLVLGCNVSSFDVKGSLYVTSSVLVIDNREPRTGTHVISTTILVTLIVVIIVLFLLVIFFFSVCVRGWCYNRKKAIYQAPSQSEINYNNIPYGDGASVQSFPKSPSKLSVRADSDYKSPNTNSSFRRMTSIGDSSMTVHRAGQLPPPPPPPKVYWRDKKHNQPAYSCSPSIREYSQPQDAIEPDFSEDGDVTSSNCDHHQGYGYASGQKTSKANPSFYSSVPVCSVDV